MALSFHSALIAPTDDVWSVSQLTTAAKRIVEGEFMPMWVRGEVVGCKVWPSGHWYFNLREQSEVTIRDRERVFRARIHEVSDPAERARLWAAAVKAYPPYADYEKRTARQIPIIILERAK